MSIIHDALNKASEINETKAITKQEIPRPSVDIKAKSRVEVKAETDFKNNMHTHNKTAPTFILALVFLCILIAGAFFTFNKGNTTFSPNYYAQPTLKSTAPAVTVASENERANIVPIQKNNFAVNTPLNLSGIAYEDKEPMAVINDTIYSEGDVVNGAQIVKILEKRVLLKRDDKEIELKVE